MATEENLAPDSWGIHRRWKDAHGQINTLSDETVRRLREAIGEPPADLEQRAPLVTRPGRDLGLGAVEVACEDGSTRQVDQTLPADFPLGYHRLRTADGAERRLIVSPGRCWLPDGWRAWGWTVQLYASRSRDSWGIGDLADLGALRAWAADAGAGFVLVNPLHAVSPTLPQEPSPYLPATRRFRNPIYLRVDDVPGADRVDLTKLRRDAARHSMIDRDAVWQAKLAALEQIFATTSDGAQSGWAGFEAWRERQGSSLQEFATWCALAERHGPDWHDWDDSLRQPTGAAVQRFVAAHTDRVTFFAWLQWLLDMQMRAATGSMPVLQDLPIGVAGGGADAWAWQDTLAGGVAVGAPPDIFNSDGQSWGSPPLIPWRLRAADYEPFIESIRATMAGAGGVRIDHVMGLFRLWWVPEGGSPGDGAYVRYPSADMLDIVALESHRAQAIVVGEDLGTVEPGVREALAEHAILSYKLLWFEEDDPAQWPVSAMAAVTTHDLPTIAGLWTGADVDEQAGLVGASRDRLEAGRRELLQRLECVRVPASASVAEVTTAAHRWLGRAPSVLVSATLEDAVAEERRPNIPGTVERDNWCIPLPVLVEDLPAHPTVAAVVDALRDTIR
ncbi:MAG TPA: 4-alpha-glucanotransferase [Nocardioidaceae bacterium]|nr:4-alpha-glucanotransferase [Nocardioidaceae bacterium]